MDGCSMFLTGFQLYSDKSVISALLREMQCTMLVNRHPSAASRR